MSRLTIILDAWQPLVGGGQKLFWELASGLVKNHQFKVTIIARALMDEQGKAYSQNESFFDGKIQVVRIGPAAPFSNLWARISFIFTAVPVALKTKPDIFMASTFLPGITLQLLRLFTNKSKVLVAIGFGAAKGLRWLEKLITQIFQYDLMITDDRQFFDKIKSRRNTQYIVNGVHLPPEKQVSKHQKFTYLFVGRNEPRKGLPVLKQAFALVKKQFSDVDLNLIGPGLKTVTDKQLDEAMFKAHCLVLPALWEGHPLVLFEAWAHKLPVIATNVGSVAQFLNKDNGYLIPASDVRALAQAMINTRQNQKLSMLGESGYQLVKSGFTWEKTVKNYFKALTSLRQ